MGHWGESRAYHDDGLESKCWQLSIKRPADVIRLVGSPISVMSGRQASRPRP